MRRFQKYNNTFYKFLASYIIILIIPIIMLGSIYYFKSLQAVTEGLGKNNQTMLKQAILTVDFRSSEADKLLSQVLVNTRIFGIANSTVQMDAKKRLDIMEVSDDLKMYMAGNNFIDILAIYFPNYNIVISGNGMYSSYDFYHLICESADMPYEKWLELLSEKGQVIETMRISNESMVREMVVQLRSIHAGAKLITFTETKKYSDIFDSLVSDSKGYYFLTDSDGEILITNDSERDYILYLDTDGKNQYTKDDMIVISESTAKKVFQCYLLVPRKTYTEEIEKIKGLTIVLIISCLVLGIIISFIMANRNYSPIRHIINKLKTIGRWNPSGYNEYEAIENLIETSLQEISIFKDTLITQPPVLGTEQARQLSDCLKAGDRQSAEQVLDGIYIENIEKSIPSTERIRRLSFDICNTVLRTVEEAHMDVSENLPIDELLLKDDIHVTYHRIKEEVYSICDFVRHEKKNSKIMNKILAYIDDNISDSNLSLENIADQFDKSSKYLSKIFKEETNCNFVDYVNTKRVHRAKEYLKYNDISYACKNSGFSSMSTFMRVFKKYSGITPGKYKDIL